MRTASPGRELCVAGLPLLLLMGAATHERQQTPAHEIRLRVSDAAAAVAWFSEGVGFEVEALDRFASGRALARLRLQDARLVLEQDQGPAPAGRTGVIKVGLLLPDLPATFARLERAFPGSVLQPVSPLPGSELPDWPVRYFLATGPDGLLVQGFDRTRPLPRTRWFLVAVNVESLDGAVAWYADHTRFEEVARPAEGTPRSLLRRGTFYLELGEFEPVRQAGDETMGVTRILLDTERPDRDCSWVTTPEAFELRYCGWVRGGWE